MTEEQIYRKAIEKYGALMQTVVAIEEMAELQKELSKALRNKVIDKAHIAEEIADVEIMIAQMKLIYLIPKCEIDEYKRIKLNRLMDSLKEG